MKKALLCVTLGVFVALGLLTSSQVFGYDELPDPTMVVDGILLTSQVDDFYAYPAKLMQMLAAQPGATWTAAEWDVITGTGGLDTLIYAGAGGQDNDPVGIAPNLFTLEDAIDAPGANISTFSGLWGYGYPVDDGPVLVDDMVDYLTETFNLTHAIPVFNFDLSEPQTGNPNAPLEYLEFVGKASIIDPGAIIVDPNTNLYDKSDDIEVAFWALDNDSEPAKQYDPTAWVTVPNIVDAGFGTSTTHYIWNNSVGNGRLDYALFAPEMDLDEYYGQGYYFVLDINFRALDDGPEEIYLTGVPTKDNPVVPEPATMSLLGLGLLGLAGFRRKR